MPTKTSPPPASTTTTRSKDLIERERFFEKCYLALLSSAMASFEVRDKNGDLQLAYDHPKLESLEEAVSETFDEDNLKLDGKQRHDALQKSISKSEDLTRQMRQEDEQWRIEVLVDRCLRMAEEATNRYMESREFSGHCNAD